MMRIGTVICLFLLYSIGIQAQESEDGKSPRAGWLVGITYAFNASAGDLADRYGVSFQVGGGVSYKTSSNFLFDADFQYQFGRDVKQDPLAGIRDENGEIVGDNNEIALVFLRQRGYMAALRINKIFPLAIENQDSGIRVGLGAGYTQNWIRVQVDTRNAPQVTGDYTKGYDRLTGGPVLQGILGYQHLSNDNRINFYIGAEYSLAFAKGQREVQYDLQDAWTDSFSDQMISLRAAWYLPFYSERTGELIFY